MDLGCPLSACLLYPECQNAQVDLGHLLGISSFSLDKMLEKDPDFLVGVLGW
jgi:hypothetical protein